MSTLLDKARRGERLTEFDIVDLHGHLGRHQHLIPDLSAAGIVRVLDRLGIRAIMLSHMQCESMHARRGNDALLEAMRAFPGRILGYVIQFPTSRAEVAAEMERCLAAGFSGLKIENVNGHSYLNPAYEPAYAIANARCLPVLLHTWGCKDQEGEEVRTLAGRYPEAAFLLAHTGASGEERNYLEMARAFGNVYLDLALSVGPRGLLERLVGAVGADRITYGSDCCFFSMTQQIGKVLGADIPDSDKAQILSGNARRLLARIVR